MNFFITLTTACDLQCRYCYGECCDDFDKSADNGDIDYFLPRDLSYPVGDLSKFVDKDPLSTLIFYGGEPLLNIKKMYELMDSLPAKRFMLHTNGTMLHKVKPEYLNRLHTISISIDGDEKLTEDDRHRGLRYLPPGPIFTGQSGLFIRQRPLAAGRAVLEERLWASPFCTMGQ